MKILSLDNATKITGWALFDCSKLMDCGIVTADAKEKNPVVRIEQIYNQVRDLIQKYSVDFVVFEETTFQANIDVLKQLSRLQGCIMALCYDNNVGFEMLFPSEWRKQLGFKGKGRDEQKKQAVDYINLHYGLKLDYKEDDKAEAICIGESMLKIIA
jgi:Holliday junction resolvasome RuvABC endonuclease subunit